MGVFVCVLLFPLHKCSYIDEVFVDKPANPFSIQLPPGAQPFLLPIQLLLKPFQKRFIYHFCSNEKTNRIDKVCYLLHIQGIVISSIFR